VVTAAFKAGKSSSAARQAISISVLWYWCIRKSRKRAKPR